MAIDWWLRSGARPAAASLFSDDELADVRVFHERQARSGDGGTPLRHLPGLAAELGAGDVLLKDESARYGLPAFKIVGAKYAIHKLIEQAARPPRHLACATAGNHGRAVARAAHDLGVEAHIYVPLGTTAGRVEALRAEGAHVIVTSEGYDETVRLMAEDAEESGWAIVSDTAWPGYDQVPRWIMVGYTRILDEAAEAWSTPPDLIIVQAGVGSLAGAAAAWLAASFTENRPRLLTVEPEGSACLLASLRAGRLTSLESCAPTRMVGLRCAEVSPLAWPVLASVADAAIAIGDDLAEEAMARLAHPAGADPVVEAGASGAAGIGALLALSRDPALTTLRDGLKFGNATRVLAIVTEGST